MASKPTCRWAVLSLTSIAAVFIPDLLGREGAEFTHELVAVSTVQTEEQGKAWLNHYKIPYTNALRVYRSWERMLQEGDFDIVYISAPHPSRYTHVLRALQNKCNVLVDKPGTINTEQWRKCCRLAKEQDVVLMQAMCTRYLPATVYLKNEILPKIGEVRRVYSEFSFPIISPDTPYVSRFLDKKTGAGSLLDQGVYALTWVDLALSGPPLNGLLSSPTKVVHASSMPVPHVPGDVDDINTVILANQQATAIVTTSMTLAGSHKPTYNCRLRARKAAPAVRIEGTKGCVCVPYPPSWPEELHVLWYGDEYLNDDGTEREEIIKKPVEGWGVWYQADVIARVVLEGQKGVVIGEAGTSQVLKWMDEVRKMANITYDAELEKV